MFRPSRTTVLIMTADRIARVDMRSSSASDVIDKWESDRPTGCGFAESVLAAVQLGSRRCGPLHILTEDIWCGSVTLSDEVVAAVPDDQLHQTLALEAEFESGVSPFDCHVGALQIERAGGTTTWELVQADASAIRSIQEQLPRWAGRIIAVGPVGTNTRLSWRLQGPDETVGGVAGLATTAIERETSESLARLWWAKYSQSPEEVLAARITSAQSPIFERRQVGVLAAGIVVLFGVIADVWSDGSLAASNLTLAQTVKQEQQLRQQVETLKAQHQRWQKEQERRLAEEANRQRRLANAKRQQLSFDARRRRPVELLQALSMTADEAHWVQQIDLDENGAAIGGVAIDQVTVTKLATAIEQQLRPVDWQLRAADITPLPESPLVRFRLEMTCDRAPSAVFGDQGTDGKGGDDGRDERGTGNVR